MRKGVLAAVALGAAFVGAAPAYGANADVYARDTAADKLCFSTNPTAAECAPNETGDVAIAPGDTVTFHFDGSTGVAGPHNAADANTPPPADPAWTAPADGSFVTSGEFSHQFDTEGVYKYVCQVHPVMKGTITVGTPDPPPDDDPPSSPPPTGGHTTTPAPSPSADSVKPKVRRVKLKALRRAVRVRFRLSEPATVTLRVKRGRKVVKSKRVQAGAGTHSVTLRSKRLKKGRRYTVEILARDASGNRSRLAKKRLSLRK